MKLPCTRTYTNTARYDVLRFVESMAPSHSEQERLAKIFAKGALSMRDVKMLLEYTVFKAGELPFEPYQRAALGDVGVTDVAVAALESDHHVVVEKPLARTSEDGLRLLAAQQQSTRSVFVGQCMRFWPGWTWLKEVIDDGRYGKVLSAKFRRVASHPGGPFYSDGSHCPGP